MTTGTKKPNIYQRINAIMSEVKGIHKEDKLVNNQYPFVSHDALSRKLHDHFVKHGVVITPSVVNASHDGNRCSLLVGVVFVNMDDPKDHFQINVLGYGVDNQDKGPGKAMSYAVKMALLKVLMLESGQKLDEDGPADPDIERDTKTNYQKERSMETPDPPKITKAPNGFIQPSSVDMMRRVAKNKATFTETELDSYLKENFKINKAEEVPQDKFNDILTDLKRFNSMDGPKGHSQVEDIPF